MGEDLEEALPAVIDRSEIPSQCPVSSVPGSRPERELTKYDISFGLANTKRGTGCTPVPTFIMYSSRVPLYKHQMHFNGNDGFLPRNSAPR